MCNHYKSNKPKINIFSFFICNKYNNLFYQTRNCVCILKTSDWSWKVMSGYSDVCDWKNGDNFQMLVTKFRCRRHFFIKVPNSTILKASLKNCHHFLVVVNKRHQHRCSLEGRLIYVLTIMQLCLWFLF